MTSHARSTAHALTLRTLSAALLGILPAWHAMAEEAPEVPSAVPEVKITGARDATTEGNGSYTTTGPLATGARLNLTPRETPQSLSIMTRERMEEQGLQTLSETMQQVTGIYVNYNDTERVTYNARGYAVNNF